MLSLTEIFTILIVHFVADFIFQTDQQAKGKSKNWKDLLSHTGVYSLVWLIIPISMYLKDYHPYRNPHLLPDDVIFYTKYFLPMIYFIIITFICHTITDYFTSRLNSKLLPPIKSVFIENNTTEMLAYPKNSSWHNFFIGVGGDQILHYIQLFLTYYYLKNSI